MLTRADLMAALRLIRSGGTADDRIERLAAAGIGLLVLIAAIVIAMVLPARPKTGSDPGSTHQGAGNGNATPETWHRAVPPSRQ
jgi:hypothetical protein